MDCKQEMWRNGVRLCWVIYHDGGFTPASDSKTSAVDTSGWGMWARLYELKEGGDDQRESAKAYRPVGIPC